MIKKIRVSKKMINTCRTCMISSEGKYIVLCTLTSDTSANGENDKGQANERLGHAFARIIKIVYTGEVWRVPKVD